MPEFHEKECSKCHLWRGPEYWHYYLGKPQQPCKDCKKLYRASRRDHCRGLKIEWNKNNPCKVKEHRRKKNLLDKFGITPQCYDQMLADQDGHCAICLRMQDSKRLAVDHCHRTGVIRCLLCDRCNRGIGLLGDDVSNLARAIAYLSSTDSKFGDKADGKE